MHRHTLRCVGLVGALILGLAYAIFGLDTARRRHVFHTQVEPVLRAPCSPVSIAAALRNDGAGWYALSDSEHEPLGLAGVETHPTYIVALYNFKAARVHALIVSPDETLAALGYSAGASVGLSSALVRIGYGGLVRPRAIDPMSLSTRTHPGSNLWMHGRMCTFGP